MIEFDYATDMPGDPNRKISMMVATDSIHMSIFAVAARRRVDSTIMWCRVSKIILIGWVWLGQI